MAKFMVTMTVPVTKIFTYEVEADSAEEAEMKVFDCRVEAIEVSEVIDEGETEIEAEQIEG